MLDAPAPVAGPATAPSSSSTTREKFHYERPAEPVDLRSGIVCSPNNFAYGEPLAEGVMRDLGPGQLRPLGRPRAGRLPAGRRPAGTTAWWPRRCGSCPTSAAR